MASLLMTMTDAATNDRLEELLIDLSRSLLQYTHEAWPWAADEASRQVRETLDELAARQLESVDLLAEFLVSRGHTLPLGVYPDDYTNLNYVSVKYLLRQIVINERAIADACAAAQNAVAGDPEAEDLVQRVAASEAEILSKLRSLN